MLFLFVRSVILYAALQQRVLKSAAGYAADFLILPAVFSEQRFHAPLFRRHFNFRA